MYERRLGFLDDLLKLVQVPSSELEGEWVRGVGVLVLVLVLVFVFVGVCWSWCGCVCVCVGVCRSWSFVWFCFLFWVGFDGVCLVEVLA